MQARVTRPAEPNKASPLSSPSILARNGWQVVLRMEKRPLDRIIWDIAGCELGRQMTQGQWMGYTMLLGLGDAGECWEWLGRR